MTVVRSLRLDEDVDGALRKISEEGESVNVIANRTLRKFVEWDRPAEKIGMVQVSRQVLVKLMDAQNLDEAKSLGAWVGIEVMEPFVQYLHTSLSLETLLSSLELLSRYSGRFTFDHQVTGAEHMIFIRHHMGIKWSSFYDGAVTSVLKDLLHIDCESDLTDEFCSFKFRLDAGERSE